MRPVQLIAGALFAVLLQSQSLASSPVAAAGAAAEAGSYLRAEDHRVASIGYRLALAGKDRCDELAPLHGLLLHQLAEYGPADRPAAIEAHRLDVAPGIVSVVAGSPASRAGLRANDLLLSVNGMSFAPPAEIAVAHDRDDDRASLELADSQLETALESGPARLEILRGDERLSLVLDPVEGCPSRFRLARSSQYNAFADGSYAIITTKLLGSLRSDEEVAIVLAHEMAHNILRHAETLREQKVPKGILRAFGKNAGRVWVTEEEADRLAVKLLWTAGYDLSAVIPFWKRFYARNDPLSLQIFRTHPSLGARERIFHDAVSELGAESP